jgi:hypothetical protein
MMTKKYYNMLAQVVKETKKYGNTLIIPDFIKKLTETLKKDNPNFDEKKFIKKAGL